MCIKKVHLINVIKFNLNIFTLASVIIPATRNTLNVILHKQILVLQSPRQLQLTNFNRIAGAISLFLKISQYPLKELMCQSYCSGFKGTLQENPIMELKICTKRMLNCCSDCRWKFFWMQYSNFRLLVESVNMQGR